MAPSMKSASASAVSFTHSIVTAKRVVAIFDALIVGA